MKALEIDRELRLMEICGTHTTTILKSGIKKLLPPNIKLISGPGCPVCVTSQGYIDAAINLSERENLIITTFGDMLNVPGSIPFEDSEGSLRDEGLDPSSSISNIIQKQQGNKKNAFIFKDINFDTKVNSLMNQRAKGKDVRVIYSPLEALNIAKKNPNKEVVFLAIGFETTAPTIALTIEQAYKENIKNFSVFTSLKTMPEAIKGLISDKEINVDGVICPGHVSTIIGESAFEFISEELHMPSVIAGFEDRDIFIAVYLLVDMIKENKHELKNIYGSAVKLHGNKKAKELIKKIFRVVDSNWRGLGVIKNSGLALSDEYKALDAAIKFNIKIQEVTSKSGCICGSILKGQKTPEDCKLFGKKCTPYSPLGVCMVSKEGTCGIHYKYLND